MKTKEGDTTSAPGVFVISLDFELAWGIWDSRSVEGYTKNILGAHQVIPRLIKTFAEAGVQATFATVGVLFLRNKSDLISRIPHVVPGYSNSRLSPYTSYIHSLSDIPRDPMHFAPELIRLIHDGGFEVGTHTFCHYYCLEAGQTAEEFGVDLELAIRVSREASMNIHSLVFPRNQFNDQYLQVAKKHGIRAFRGNEDSWLHPGDHSGNVSPARRSVRLIDSYFNITGHHTANPRSLVVNGLVNIPSSRFLRPYVPELAALDWLKLNRIRRSMTHAARTGEIYHLWWHPHNFGQFPEQNFSMLGKILEHYAFLKDRYGFRSMNMRSLADELLTRTGI